MTDPTSIDKAIKEHFLRLPKVVQNAITSADVEKQLRSLADMHKLHLDQWEKLENEVMMALLGIQRVEDLEQNITTNVGASNEVARALAIDVNAVIFDPIRQELERQLELPDAATAAAITAEAVGAEAFKSVRAEDTPITPAAPTPPAVQPATPPSPPPDVKIARPSESTAYKPGEASAERKNIVDDPYREPPK